MFKRRLAQIILNRAINRHWHDGYSKQEGAEGNMVGVSHLWVPCQRCAEEMICVDL